MHAAASVRVLAWSAVLLAATACIEAPIAPTPATNGLITVAGRVFDVQANRGVPGAPLEWRAGGTLLGNGTRVVTDGAGFYSVQVPLADVYTVSGLAAGTVRLPYGLYTVQFLNSIGGCPSRYGIVIDAITKQPIAGALVHWAFVETLSNANGSYVLNLQCGRQPGVGTGTTAFSASHASYNTWSRFDARAETLGRAPATDRFDIALMPR